MARRIVQFGSSRFLQAHADLFVHEARAAGEDIGPIAVVKTTAGVERAGRVEALRQPGGFPVRIRGYRDGRLCDETIQVQSVDQALTATADWPRIADLFANEAEIAVSNVGDGGYELAAEDMNRDASSKRAPVGFPAKLLALLLARYEANARPFLFLPCELLRSNGMVLGELVTGLASKWQTSSAFRNWLRQSVVFADTLVDRIVSEEIEPVGAVAEPYALWAIRRGSYDQPFTHAAITVTDDLEPFERLKLHILNLGHTVLAEDWIRQRRPAGETVAQILDDPVAYGRLAEIYDTEVIPGFAARGMGQAARPYAATTIERLRNPFLNHRIRDIAENHTAKIDRRIRSFIAWIRERQPAIRLPLLTAIAEAH